MFGQLGSRHQAEYEEHENGILTAAVTELRSHIYTVILYNIYKHIKIYAASGIVSYNAENCFFGWLVVAVC
jgi:hypothetical protein